MDSRFTEVTFVVREMCEFDCCQIFEQPSAVLLSIKVSLNRLLEKSGDLKSLKRSFSGHFFPIKHSTIRVAAQLLQPSFRLPELSRYQ